ncbi:MAG: hypothetical protein ACE5E6_02860 [Phycisphaerae bacterium]
MSATIDMGGAAVRSRPWRVRRRGVYVLLGFTAVFHVGTLFNPFFIDDYVYIDTVHDLDWAGARDMFTTSTMGEEASGVWWTPEGALPFYRPIGEMTFAADYAVWGLTPFGYHVTNLALHVLCTWLVWRLARRVLDVDPAALAAATLFALHPVHNEAVVWISGRFDLLVCACMLGAVLAFSRWRRAETGGARWLAASAACFVVGLGCKETALILPAVLVVVAWLDRGHGARGDGATDGAGVMGRVGDGVVRRGGAARSVVAAAVFATIAGLYAAWRFALFGGLGHLPPPYGVDFSAPWAALASVAGNIAQYLLDFVLFIQVDAIYGAAMWSKHRVVMVIALSAAVGIFATCAVLGWRFRACRLGMAWIALFTAPALMAMAGERNVYSSSVGVALMAGAAWAGVSRYANTRAVPARWVRRLSAAVVCLCVVVGIVEQGVGWCVTWSGEQVFRDLEALMPEPPRDARIFVVHQCPLNAVGFDQAVRLRYGRDDVSGCALSLSPTLTASSTDMIMPIGPASIRLVRDGGVFFESFIERFHLFSEPASSLPRAARRIGLELLHPPSSYDGLRTLTFRLPHPINDPRIQFFTWDNDRVRRAADIPAIMKLARLTRSQLGAAAATTAVR